MFIKAATQSASLTAVGHALTYNDPVLTAEERTAASTTHLFIQQVALAHCQNNGLDIGDPDLFKSQAWYDAITWAFTEHAGWVELVGDKSVQVSKETHSGSLNLSAIMGAVMSLYLGPVAASEWSALSDLLGGAKDPAITDFMNFWWSHTKKSTQDSGFSAGPVVKSTDGFVQWAVCYYTFTEEIDDWRTMFVSSRYESVNVYTAGLTLQFDLNLYKSTAQQAVEERLGKAIAKNIRNVPLLSSPRDNRPAPAPGRAPSGSIADRVAAAPMLDLSGLAVPAGW